MKIRNFSCLLLTAILLALSPSSILAQTSIVVKYPGGGNVATATVPANTAPSTPIVFYYVSKGNVTSQIGVEVQGPKGLEASVEATQMKGSAQDSLEKGKFWKLYLTGSLVGADKKVAAMIAESAIPQRSAVVLRSGNPLCSALPSFVIEAILTNLSEEEGRQISYEEYCSGTFVPSGGSGGTGSDLTPGSDTGSIDLPSGTNIPVNNQPSIDQRFGAARGILQKDNCAGKIKNYLVKVTVKLNKVAAQDLAQGFDVLSRLQEAEYDGPRVASMKPVSDGKYAPRPLLLMQNIGGKQWINMVKWVKGIPRTVVKVPATNDLAFHRGYVLIRIVADRLLAGGRGEMINFELANGETIYNVCGKRARVRWRINGYPS